MPQRTLHRCFLLLLLLAACPLFAQTYNLGSSPQRILSLNGKWRFHPGDNPSWASPSIGDSSWPLLQSNQPWSSQGYPNLTGYASYRFTVEVPAGFPQASILMPPIFNGYQLYENGRLIGACGPYQPTFQITTTHPKVFPLITSDQHTEQTIQMAVRVWYSPRWAHYAGGGPIAGS